MTKGVGAFFGKAGRMTMGAIAWFLGERCNNHFNMVVLTSIVSKPWVVLYTSGGYGCRKQIHQGPGQVCPFKSQEMLMLFLELQ